MYILKNSVILVFLILIFLGNIEYINILKNKNKKLINRINKLEEQIFEMQIESTKKLIVTAYSNSIDETDSTPNITASNKKIRPGYVAVSRDLFFDGWTFGKKIYIYGLGIYQIEDLMNAKYKNRIDIFIGNKKKAIEFGKKEMVVVLLG